MHARKIQQPCDEVQYRYIQLVFFFVKPPQKTKRTFWNVGNNNN